LNAKTLRHWGMSHSHLACSPTSMSQSMKDAERLCQTKGGRLTPIRRQVLRLLLEADRPAKAYDLLGQMTGDATAKPPTVYRALEFLMDMGLAHRIESLNAFVACGHWGHGHSAVFLICETCGWSGEMHADQSIKKLSQEIAAVGFTMRAAIMEIRGLCEGCGQRAARKKLNA